MALTTPAEKIVNNFKFVCIEESFEFQNKAIQGVMGLARKPLSNKIDTIMN